MRPDGPACNFEEDRFWVHPAVGKGRITSAGGRLHVDRKVFADMEAEGCPTCEWLAFCDEQQWTAEIAAEVQVLRELLEDRPDSAPWTTASLQPIVHLFAPGEHVVARVAFRGDEFHFMRLTVETEKTFSASVAPETGENRMLIVPGRAHDRARVDHYVQEIEEGRRPRLLMFSAEVATQHKSWGDLDHQLTLLLDGHHKLEAYLETGVPIHVVDITRAAE